MIGATGKTLVAVATSVVGGDVLWLVGCISERGFTVEKIVVLKEASIKDRRFENIFIIHSVSFVFRCSGKKYKNELVYKRKWALDEID